MPDLNTTDLDAAERIVAKRARSTGIAVIEARTTQGRAGPAPCRQVTARGGQPGPRWAHLGAGEAVTAD